jgi:pyruvate,water dikinase
VEKKTVTTEELDRMLQAGKKVTLLDVRRKEDYEKSPEGIGNAQWRDPASVEQWMRTLSGEEEVVVYCARGGSVSQSVQRQLTQAGINVKYLEGGIEAYRNNP